MKKNILIIEDTCNDLNQLILTLSDNYEVSLQVDANEAIEIINTEGIHLILISSYFIINNHSIYKLIRAKNIPLIALIDNNENDNEFKKKYEVDDFLIKPYNSNTILIKTQRVLEDYEIDSNNTTLSLEDLIENLKMIFEFDTKGKLKQNEKIALCTKVLCEKLLSLYPTMMSSEYANRIIQYVSLHDIGMTVIPSQIINKRDDLTHTEYDIMKEHTTKGAILLKKTDKYLKREARDDIEIAVEIVEMHHEKYDGSGYPYGISGNDIPLSARIVSLIDSYDSLRNVRPYRKAYSHRETLFVIVNGDGRTLPEHFDPLILEAFILVEEQFANIYDS